MPIRKDQEYLSCLSAPGDASAYRIRVVSDPVTTPGVYGFGKVMVATVTSDGRLLRQRWISVSQLHETPTTGGGSGRKTGYYRVKEVPDAQ